MPILTSRPHRHPSAAPPPTATAAVTPTRGSSAARRLGGAVSAVVGLAGVIATLTTAPASAAAPPAPRPAGDWPTVSRAVEQGGTASVTVYLRRPGAAVPVADEIALYAKERASLLRHLGLPATGSATGSDAAGVPAVTVRVTAAQLDRLATADTAASISLNRPGAVSGTSAFGSAGGQQLPSRWDYTRINATWANNQGWTGRGQYVVVVDTGVDRTNPYLTNRVVNEACFATNTDGSGACGNGSYFQYATGASGLPGAAAPCTYTVDCAHGTFVAHQAAGQYGVAQGARIIAIRTAHPELVGGVWQPRFNDGDFVNALWYVDRVLPAANIVPAAVNYSVGGAAYSGYCDAAFATTKTWIDALRNDWQIPVVVSSGNANSATGVGTPGCISSVISVGNTTMTAASGGVDAVYGLTPTGSNSNATLDLLAPGTDICSAVPKNLDADGTVDGWSCGWIGTSMAAPQVTGAIAILTQKRPTATVAQFLARLQVAGVGGGVAVTDSRNGVTRTRIDVANAVYNF